MNKRALNAIWNMTRQKYGIYLRLLEALPEDKFHEHVVQNMRTPAELVAHTSGGIVREIAKGVASGEIKQAPGDSEAAAEMKTKEDVLAFARKCWEDADAAVDSIGDDELSRNVKTPWGIEFPGGVGIHTLNDEFMHHRGQLYVYARTCGVEPPFLWSFDKNPEGFAGPAA